MSLLLALKMQLYEFMVCEAAVLSILFLTAPFLNPTPKSFFLFRLELAYPTNPYGHLKTWWDR